MSENTHYDPYIPSGAASSNPSGGSGVAGNSRTAQIQAQIDETVGVMRDNINKVNERGENLDSLQDKTDNLSVSAQGFRRGANRVRKRMWWKDMKMRLIIIFGIIALLAVIIIPSAFYGTKHDNNDEKGQSQSQTANGTAHPTAA
ncbi:hypothetical protein MVES_002832 [Malassezia vespertilionis]|uniref:V-SNARE coiled-coil homology domain-containing protein n=1 Tax=Malassezia vespertilionis TaxID=2020962 RepID=A0A2N1J9Z2_9BASI|nr:hypothetical protein MVES_002832 [Malassezia vespertilionis]